MRRRRGVPRARILRLTAAGVRADRWMYPPVEGIDRPRTRGDCVDGPRPCPWAGCRHHLYLEVNADTGSIKINFPAIEPGDLESSCSLDIAERGSHTLEEIGQLTNLTRERARQIETRALLHPDLQRFRREAA